MIDDLVTKGVAEPYRMFTSRAEFRLLLRQDNADIRLTKKGHELGLASDERLSKLKMKEDKTNLLIKFLSKESVDLNKINTILKNKKSKIITQKVKYKKILSRPHINISDLQDIDLVKEFILKESINTDAIEQAEIEIKYGGYLSREKETAKKLVRLENIKINKDFEFDKLHSISTEGREKLKEIQPTTIGQASRISGVSPSDINILLIYLGR